MNIYQQNIGKEVNNMYIKDIKGLDKIIPESIDNLRLSNLHNNNDLYFIVDGVDVCKNIYDFLGDNPTLTMDNTDDMLHSIHSTHNKKHKINSIIRINDKNEIVNFYSV